MPKSKGLQKMGGLGDLSSWRHQPGYKCRACGSIDIRIRSDGGKAVWGCGNCGIASGSIQTKPVDLFEHL